jgi:quercetin dioxygenase-like cupin family protein
MTAPRYRSKTTGDEVEAVRFVAADPTTHWHVNVGDIVSQTLGGAHYVKTWDGAIIPQDGDWVTVRGSVVSVLSDAEFTSEFEAVPDEAV